MGDFMADNFEHQVAAMGQKNWRKPDQTPIWNRASQ
jgi:hypothetical protein